MSVKKDELRGTWEVKFSYRNYAGERKWAHKRGFEKKSDAVKWEEDFKRKVSGSNDMTLETFVGVYKEYLKTRVKETTMFNKVTVIEKWIIPYLGKKPLNQISTVDIINWQNSIIEIKNHKTDEPYKKSYLKSIHSQFTALMSHAVKFYGLASNPCKIVGNMGNEFEEHSDFWTLEEYKKFSEAIKHNQSYYCLFEILYWCGLRLGELMALELSDIDLENKTINISKTLTRLKGKDVITSPKTRKSKRVVKMPDFLVEELKTYIESVYVPDKTIRLFNLGKSSIGRFLKRGAKRAGVKSIRIHDLRHSHVSLLIELGYNVTAIGNRLGHENQYMTLHYSHMFPTTEENMITTLEGLKENNKTTCMEESFK